MDFVEWLKVVFLGLVEGITEWLPISSTGHMILVDEFIKLRVSEEFKAMFLVVIQLGAILAVVLLYFKQLWPFSTKEKYYIKKDTFSMWFKILTACVPAGVIGILFDDEIDALLMKPVIVAVMLVVYGVLFIVIERRLKASNGQLLKSNAPIADISQITYKTALWIGLFQMLALIPGTSRSGATIIGGMLVGTSRAVAAEFTFFLAVPVMAGASLIKLLKFGMETGFALSGDEIGILVTGMLVAFLVSIVVIRFLMSYIRKHNFVVFGWYRIVLGIILLGYFVL
ncbi:MAG: undecaprenyl-diphosphate phosphatase [Lachnospiraceae bacterium]|nr:undecaprenyl-diphosphate phosphatase [Lachnospiraceae bacterium]